MSISYRVTERKNNKVNIYNNAACYITWYHRLSELKDITVMIYKRIHTKEWYYDNPVTKEEFDKYISLLHSIGFKFDVIEQEYYYDFHINTANNSIVAIKILLNAIRYLEEGSGYINIVRKFLYLCSRKVIGVNYFSRLLLSHYTGKHSNGGHTFCHTYGIHPLLTNEQVDNIIFKNDANERVYVIIPCTSKAVVRPDLDNLQNAVNNEKSLTKLVKLYKELCVKYS